MFKREKVAALVAEFFGTAVLSLAVFAVAARTSFPFFPAIIAGLVVGIFIMTVGAVSGAHLNPAVTFGLWSQRKIDSGRAVSYIAVQMLAGLVAWKTAEFLLDQKTQHLADWGLDQRVLVAEIIGTLIFGFGIAAAINLSYEGSKFATVVGGSLAMGIMVASLASNGLLNPAVALGVNSMSWAYAVGPLLGSVLGMSMYNLVFVPAKKRVKATKAPLKSTKKSTKKK